MAALPSIVVLLFVAAGGAFASESDTLLTELRSTGSFQHAFRLAISPQGAIYVSDVDRNQILLVGDDRTPAMSIGGYGWEASTFDRPTGLTTDGLNLFVADHGNHRIQRFDRSLNFVSSFSTRDTSVSELRIGYPLGIALSRSGELFVLDGENLRIVKFGPTLRFERSFGDIDDQRARLRRPLKILVGSSDHIFVLEPDRLLEFDMFGQYLRTVGEGVLAEAKSFALTQGGFIILSADVVRWFSERGEQTGLVRSQHLITEVPMGPIEDAFVVGDHLYLLTTTRLHVFRVSVTGL